MLSCSPANSTVATPPSPPLPSPPPSDWEHFSLSFCLWQRWPWMALGWVATPAAVNEVSIVGHGNAELQPCQLNCGNSPLPSPTLPSPQWLGTFQFVFLPVTTLTSDGTWMGGHSSSCCCACSLSGEVNHTLSDKGYSQNACLCMHAFPDTSHEVKKNRLFSSVTELDLSAGSLSSLSLSSPSLWCYWNLTDKKMLCIVHVSLFHQ